VSPLQITQSRGVARCATHMCIFRFISNIVFVCGLSISTPGAKPLEHPAVAERPPSRLTSNQRILLVTAPEAEARPAGTVRTNPNDGQKYVWIPPGEFEIGCSPSDNECKGGERGRHSVTVKISLGFWLGQTEVTQAAYEKTVGHKLFAFKGPQHPVEGVNWYEAREYCQAAGGRLPTEAEWEYAARAGSIGARYGQLDAIAWYVSNSDNQTHPARQKQPNSWGLFDMLGNAKEWVADWYDEDYYQTLLSVAADPKGPPNGVHRVLRGGCWDDSPGDVRVSSRDFSIPSNRSVGYGFRCARSVIP
jgi:formylglycine-generating enzyme required for sulfatase activity